MTQRTCTINKLQMEKWWVILVNWIFGKNDCPIKIMVLEAGKQLRFSLKWCDIIGLQYSNSMAAIIQLRGLCYEILYRCHFHLSTYFNWTCKKNCVWKNLCLLTSIRPFVVQMNFRLSPHGFRFQATAVWSTAHTSALESSTNTAADKFFNADLPSLYLRLQLNPHSINTELLSFCRYQSTGVVAE